MSVKILLSCSLALPALCALGSNVHAQTADAVLNQTIELSATAQSFDDTVIAMARAADVNVFADATDLSQQPAFSGRGRQNFADYLGELETQRAMAQARLAPQTFLFWQRPQSTLDVARRIAAGETIARIDDAPTTKATLQALRLYLQDTFAWDGKGALPVKSIAVRDLPPDLREKVAAQIQANLLSPEAQVMAMAPFRDDFWKTARLQFRSLPKPPATPAQVVAQARNMANWPQNQMLMLQGGELMMSLGQRDLPPDSQSASLYDLPELPHLKGE